MDGCKLIEYLPLGTFPKKTQSLLINLLSELLAYVSWQKFIFFFLRFFKIISICV